MNCVASIHSATTSQGQAEQRLLYDIPFSLLLLLRPSPALPHSATTKPLITRCNSAIPFGAPLTTRGPRPGCLTPSAAPNILLPGSPIRGAPCSGCAARIAGSDARGSDESTPLNEEDINALSVGCEGMLGNVGEGSRSLSCGEPLPL